LRTAYQLISGARDQLSKMSVTNPKELNYNYCLAVINGRLFVLAQSLGETNNAGGFFKGSAFYWNQHRRESRLAPANFTPDMIETMMQEYDAKVHPAERISHLTNFLLSSRHAQNPGQRYR
jgi:hypothetical protein